MGTRGSQWEDGRIPEKGACEAAQFEATKISPIKV